MINNITNGVTDGWMIGQIFFFNSPLFFTFILSWLNIACHMRREGLLRADLEFVHQRNDFCMYYANLRFFKDLAVWLFVFSSFVYFCH